MSNKNIMVSICCITYNHENFIRDAIEGFLMQQTNFDYEIIIANDCSPDNTDSFVKKYINNHPKGKLIKYFRHDKNIGVMPNFIFALKQCTGKYIALCEGDDYWTDPYKLQKQVDFLEANLDYTICFHLVENFYEDGSKPNLIFPPLALQKHTYTIDDVLKNYFINTCSVMYRWQFYDKPLPSWITNHMLGDYQLHLLYANKGKIGLIPEVMAKYRIHVGGILSTKVKEKKEELLLDRISILNCFNKYTQYYNNKIIKHEINKTYYAIVKNSIDNFDKIKSKELFKEYRKNICGILKLKLLLLIYFPFIIYFVMYLKKMNKILIIKP